MKSLKKVFEILLNDYICFAQRCNIHASYIKEAVNNTCYAKYAFRKVFKYFLKAWRSSFLLIHSKDIWRALGHSKDTQKVFNGQLEVLEKRFRLGHFDTCSLKAFGHSGTRMTFGHSGTQFTFAFGH